MNLLNAYQATYNYMQNSNYFISLARPNFGAGEMHSPNLFAAHVSPHVAQHQQIRAEWVHHYIIYITQFSQDCHIIYFYKLPDLIVIYSTKAQIPDFHHFFLWPSFAKEKLCWGKHELRSAQNDQQHTDAHIQI